MCAFVYGKSVDSQLMFSLNIKGIRIFLIDTCYIDKLQSGASQGCRMWHMKPLTATGLGHLSIILSLLFSWAF